jgi:hypothetical protein
MKPRSCGVTLTIADESGRLRSYAPQPVPPAELAATQWVAAFRLVERLRPEGASRPVEFVRLSPSAIVDCTCERHTANGSCEHADALTAAQLLPLWIVEKLWEAKQAASVEAQLAEQRAAAIAAQVKPRRPRKQKAA